MKHIVKAFVYGFRVPRHRYGLNLRRLLVCLLYIPFSERSKGVDQVKTLATLETRGAKMEETRRVLPRYKEWFAQMRGPMLRVKGKDIRSRKNACSK